MTLTISTVLKNLEELTKWYTPLKFFDLPQEPPKTFPCIAILAQSGDDPFIATMLSHSDEKICYIYPSNFE